MAKCVSNGERSPLVLLTLQIMLNNSNGVTRGNSAGKPKANSESESERATQSKSNGANSKSANEQNLQRLGWC
jgi:hypothetical protein